MAIIICMIAAVNIRYITGDPIAPCPSSRASLCDTTRPPRSRPNIASHNSYLCPTVTHFHQLSAMAWSRRIYLPVGTFVPRLATSRGFWDRD
ncbi:hypothetical protein GGR56DRAFT_11022 [Xylariaceae sp. FL0804]|nr:hypothetical protein GGR56DRAFT_11022 [Xylariaceae sp. FL0804]